MDTSQKQPRCAVCGAQTYQHGLLVIDDSWLDELKILTWHPKLAQQPQMHAVCGKRHLDILLTHWLTYGNLDFSPPANLEFSGFIDSLPFENHISPGHLIGNLAVHRDSLSRLWAGSAEARESIFQALVDGLEFVGTTPAEIKEGVAVPSAGDAGPAGEPYAEYAFQ